MAASPFLTAAWRKLIMASYVVPAEVLAPHLPLGTELDLYEGRCFVSLIGFLFDDVRLKGLRVPFHSTFEEVNLRFYVRPVGVGDGSRRGVVFLQELVPRLAVTVIANTLYGESYVTRATRHTWVRDGDLLNIRYEWKWRGEWKSMAVTTGTGTRAIAAGSVEEFITEHYWGYTRLSATKSSGYEVAHPRWEVYPVRSFATTVDFAAQYGPAFAQLQGQEPASVLLAEGSDVAVLGGGTLAKSKRR